LTIEASRGPISIGPCGRFEKPDAKSPDSRPQGTARFRNDAMSIQVGMPLVLILTLVTTVGCDRVTKHVATNILAGSEGRSFLSDSLRLSYVENTGGFLSLGAGLPRTARTAVFTLATGLMLLGAAAMGIRFRWSGWRAFGLTLFVAGGLSNWLDRALRGSVVDFVNVGVGPLRTGVFNVADVAILLGVAMVIACEFRHGTHADRIPGDST
jgi:signal peptidase II